jgi:hypothetical protein
MALTDPQLAALKAHIEANTDPDLVAALAIRNDTEIARLYNLDSAFMVWRTEIRPDEYCKALDWTEVDNISVGKARVWDWSTQFQTANIDASNANLRLGIAQAFGGNSDTTANLTALAKRAASIYETVFATGTGTTNSPGDLVVEGALDISTVGRALNA